MNTHSITRALQERSFLFLWLAELFSQIAFNMMNFILILVAFSLTNSSTAVSGVVLAFTVPAIIFGLLAGVFVDHWDKKKVLFATNLIRAVFLIILAIAHTNLMLLYFITFAISIATQFFIPAETPIIPIIVSKELLFSANALFGIALYGSILIAYALSGSFLILFGKTYAFLLLAFFFFLASFFVHLIHESKVSVAQSIAKYKKISIVDEIKEALSVIVKTKDVYNSFILLILTQMLILIISVLGPGYARQVLNIRINEFPLLFVTPAAIGMALGAILLTTYFHQHSKQKSATLGLFISAASVLLLPYGSKVASRSFVHVINEYLPRFLKINILHIMVVLAFVMGFALALVFVPSNTIIQENTTDEIRGKVYGALNAMAGLFSLIPVIVAGSLADIFGVSGVLTGVGIGIAGIGVYRVFFD